MPPVSGTSAANKSYVDSQIIVNATPNATSTVLGKIQLTGDLLGSSATFSNSCSRWQSHFPH